MKSSRQKITGFTLVEVMVVVIIIAVLAAVAIPLMSGNVKRAISSEGIAGLGTIRSNMRAMRAETGDYKTNPDGDTVTDPIDHVPGFSEGDLDGQYFSDNDYSITVQGDPGPDQTFLLECTGDGGTTDAPGAKKAEEFTIWMTSQGTIKLNKAAGGKTDAAPNPAL